MPRVTVELPSLLARFAGGVATVAVEAETLAGALRALVRQYPALELHLFDERGAFRRHVLCFHNGVNSRWIPDLERALAAGDRIALMQAVSGG